MKKLYFSLIAFCFLSFANAQIINIPDANFKARLLAASPTNNTAKNLAGNYFKIDANNDGEVQESEAINVVQLNINSPSEIYDNLIADLTGVEYFTNINYLNCSFNKLTNLNLSSNNSLSSLYCHNNQLANLNINSNIYLYIVNCSDNQLINLNLSSNINLHELNCTYNQITYLNLNNNTDLNSFNCSYNQLSNLNVNSNTSLYVLSCDFNQLSNLNVENNTNLHILSCSNNLLTNLNLNYNSYLKDLYCSNNQLNYLTLNSNYDLTSLYCNNNLLTSLNVNSNPNLIYLFCKYNLLTSLFIKNNNNDMLLYFENNPNLYYICANERQITSIQAQIVTNGIQATCNVNSYCSFTPGGTFYTIQGNNKYDENNNGCDALDLAYINLKLNFSDGTNSGALIANNTSSYKYDVQAGTHTITPILENPTYFDISPTSATVTFPATTSPAIQDFCITAIGVHNDLEISILPINAARPGFDANYKIIYKNKGNQTQSGSVNLAFNDAVLDFVSANPVATSQVSNDLSFGFTNLLPFESREISVVFNLNSPMETPALNSGNILNYTTTITNTSDETPLDNSFTLNQNVVNSFDPNDKTCLEGNKILPAKVGDYVNYMIRFENTGTFPAQNIVVKDMIDTTKFDITSLIPIKGSHSFVTRITETNKVEFIFENINLPFNDANNDGYVAFKIKTKSTLVLGNTFSNSASIYFDYNFPIVTDSAVTTVSNALANQDFEFSNYFSIYPNPVKNLLNIKNKSNIEISSISIYNTLGQLIQVNTKPSQTIDVSELKSGNYLVKIVSDKGTSNTKFIKE